MRTRILPDTGLMVKCSNNIRFHFRLSLRKTNHKISQKILKNPISGPFWVLFAQIWAKMNSAGKKGSISF